jgi:hypothetical protein
LAAILGLVTVVTALILAAATEPAAITLDMMFSITGFCAGFLYASYLYDPRVRVRTYRKGPVGPMGPRGPAGLTGPTGSRGERGQSSAE